MPGRVQQRLVLVRAVNVHQPLTEAGQHVQRRGGTVNELAVGAGAGERAPEDKLILFARLQTVFIEKRFHRGFEAANVEYRFHRARLAAGADQRAVSPLAQHQIQGANKNGFAGAGLAGNDVVTGLQLQSEVRYQGEVLDPKRR